MAPLRRFLFCRPVPAFCIAFLFALGACDEEQQKPTENNTYNVHLYYGKDVKEHKSLGQVVGISRCKQAVHTRAAQMNLKPHTYTYACCWVHAGEACYEKHK